MDSRDDFRLRAYAAEKRLAELEAKLEAYPPDLRVLWDAVIERGATIERLEPEVRLLAESHTLLEAEVERLESLCREVVETNEAWNLHQADPTKSGALLGEFWAAIDKLRKEVE